MLCAGCSAMPSSQYHLYLYPSESGPGSPHSSCVHHRHPGYVGLGSSRLTCKLLVIGTGHLRFVVPLPWVTESSEIKACLGFWLKQKLWLCRGHCDLTDPSSDGDTTCPEDLEVVAWNVTKAGFVAQAPCPLNKRGMIKRLCASDGIWGPVQNSCTDAKILTLCLEAKVKLLPP